MKVTLLITVKKQLSAFQHFFFCEFVTFPFGILGQVWYLIESIPDPCCLSYYITARSYILFVFYCVLSYDVASGSEITACNKICKPLVVYRLSGKVMTSITTLRT